MPRSRRMANTEQRIKSMAIQISSRCKVTSRSLMMFLCPLAMILSSRTRAARYSQSGISLQRLMATADLLFWFRYTARTTAPLTLVTRTFMLNDCNATLKQMILTLCLFLQNWYIVAEDRMIEQVSWVTASVAWSQTCFQHHFGLMMAIEESQSMGLEDTMVAVVDML